MSVDAYILLLSKQLSGELDAAGAQQLDEWLRQSPEHQRLADEIRQVWAKTGTYTPELAADLEAGFARVQAKLQAPAPTARVIPLGRTLLRLAAALALVLSAVWVFRQFATPTPAMRVEMAQQEPARQLELPDGSRVWLRQGARLEFPEPFAAAERSVRLEGEAYFEVQADPQRPFRIHASTGEQVEVVGTRFGLRMGAAGPTAVLVKSGQVRFSPDGRQEGAYLTAGKKAVYDRFSAKITVTDLTSFNELAWQSGGLEFVHTPLSQVVADLESWYGVEIDLKNEGLQRCLHTAPLTTQPIEQVLQSLALTYRMQVSNPSPQHFVLSGGVCQ